MNSQPTKTEAEDTLTPPHDTPTLAPWEPPALTVFDVRCTASGATAVVESNGGFLES